MRYGCSGWGSDLEIEAPPRRSAGIISGQACSADIGPHGIDRARRRYTDVSNKGRTAIAAASHAAPFIIDIGAGDAIEIGIGLQREPRPLRRK
jgi:hypothetical protein